MTASRSAESTPGRTAAAGPAGLTSAAAATRLVQVGPNEVPEARPRPLRDFLARFWGPVPWMLELGIGLELLLGRRAQAAAFSALLVVNGVVAFAQQRRAAGALAALRRQLAVVARVRRDGRWQRLPAREIVPDDVVHVRMGDLVPADLRTLTGQILVDQSAVTGEAAPAELGPGATAYAGTVVRRGESTGQVIATGARTAFGQAAELVAFTRTRAHLDRLVFRVVGYLVAVDGVLAAAVAAYAWHAGLPPAPVVEYILMLLIASVPVALPATFTLATALGARHLAGRGVLVARLAAVEDAAAMDVLCADKTGTITRNELTVTAVEPVPPATARDVVRWAALCSDEATQDPIDLAILGAAQGGPADGSAREAADVGAATRVRFVPFDPATKRSEAMVRTTEGELHVAKGAVRSIASLTHPAPYLEQAEARLSAQGMRVIGVAAGVAADIRPVGVIGLSDPPRDDAAALLARLRELGVRTIMVTGDAAPAARFVAHAVGLGDQVCPSEEIAGDSALGPDASPGIADCDAFAGVLPADKVRLVETLQREGHIVGMTGDGVNDAAALRQAEVGVAVAGAVDVAKSAASVVLTAPGLAGILDIVDHGRRIYRRMLTYTINKVAKTFHVALFLGVGLFATGTFVTTPTLILLLLIANDLVTMSLATDHVRPAPRPEVWKVRAVAGQGLAIASAWLLATLAVFVVGRDVLGLQLAQLQTLGFLALVYTGQATIYLVRCDGPLWSTRPSGYLLAGTAFAVLAASLMGAFGVLMAAAPARVVGALLLAIAVATLALDAIKVGVPRLSAAASRARPRSGPPPRPESPRPSRPSR